MWGQPRVGARKLTATRSRNLPKAVSRAGQPKPSARAVSLGSAMRRLALETCGPLSAAGEFIRALPGEGGQLENVGIRHSCIERTSARIGGSRMGALCVSRVSLARGARANIGRGGGARVRAGPGGRLRLSFGEDSPLQDFFSPIFFNHVPTAVRQTNLRFYLR